MLTIVCLPKLWLLSSNERSERFFEIHLESMIRSPDVVIPDMLKFLGLKENEKVYQLANRLLHRDLTLTSWADHLYEHTNSGFSEEELLALAGPDLRNLIFQHSYHL